jgi:hypothetical protein
MVGALVCGVVVLGFKFVKTTFSGSLFGFQTAFLAFR